MLFLMDIVMNEGQLNGESRLMWIKTVTAEVNDIYRCKRSKNKIKDCFGYHFIHYICEFECKYQENK